MPRLRAALIALAIVVYGIAAAPIPQAVKKKHVFSPSGRDELRRWVQVLDQVGLELTVKELGDAVVDVAQPFTEARQLALTPFKPWYRLTGTGQRWGVFAYPDTRPHRLTIACDRGDGWETLFAAGDPDHAWASVRLRHRRMRGVWDGVAKRKKPGRVYEDFVDLVASWVADEHPSCTELRVSYWQLHAVGPGETADEPQEVHVRERPLGAE